MTTTHKPATPRSFNIITNASYDTKGNVLIGSVRELPNGKWIWTTLFNRAGRAQYDTAEAAIKSVKRAIGGWLRFEERT